MKKERINEYRAKLQKGQVSPVNWSKVAHDRYETVEKLLHELEVETDHPQPILGLDWREIKKQFDAITVFSCGFKGDIDHILLNDAKQIVHGIIATLKKQPEQWVVIKITLPYEAFIYYVVLDKLKLENTNQYFGAEAKERAKAECNQRNGDVVEWEPNPVYKMREIKGGWVTYVEFKEGTCDIATVYTKGNAIKYTGFLNATAKKE